MPRYQENLLHLALTSPTFFLQKCATVPWFLCTDLSSRDWIMGTNHWSSFFHVVGVFRQLLWLFIYWPSTYFSSFQGVCFNRNLPVAALLRQCGVCLRTCDSLEQNSFHTRSVGCLLSREKSLSFVFDPDFIYSYICSTYFQILLQSWGQGNTYFYWVLWQVLKLYYNMIYQLPWGRAKYEWLICISQFSVYFPEYYIAGFAFSLLQCPGLIRK